MLHFVASLNQIKLGSDPERSEASHGFWFPPLQVGCLGAPAPKEALDLQEPLVLGDILLPTDGRCRCLHSPRPPDAPPGPQPTVTRVVSQTLPRPVLTDPRNLHPVSALSASLSWGSRFLRWSHAPPVLEYLSVPSWITHPDCCQGFPENPAFLGLLLTGPVTLGK